MDNKHQHTSIVGPSLLIGVGILLLLDNLGYLQWDFWQLTRLWPVLLIVWGLDLLLEGHLAGRIFTAAIVITFVVGGAWMLNDRGDHRISSEIAYVKEDTSSLVLELKPAIGKLALDAYSDSANLIGGTVTFPRGIDIEEIYTPGVRARLRMTVQNKSRSWWPGQHESWDLLLNPDALLDMDLDLGIGEMDLNLSQLEVNRANVNFGIGAARIDLPEAGHYDILIDGGIGTIIIEIPRDLAVRITTDTGIVSKTMPQDYTRVENSWISPQFDESDNRVNISLSLGIGSIIVKRAP